MLDFLTKRPLSEGSENMKSEIKISGVNSKVGENIENDPSLIDTGTQVSQSDSIEGVGHKTDDVKREDKTQVEQHENSKLIKTEEIKAVTQQYIDNLQSSLYLDIQDSNQVRMSNQAIVLKDKSRMSFFQSCIEENHHLIKGKRVLVIGSGIGLIPLLCARAEASNVYSIENSGLASAQRRLVRENGYENVIEVIQKNIIDIIAQGKMKKVDVIISDWMGSHLFGRDLCTHVIEARKTLLVEGGIMIPDKVRLYVVGVDDKEGSRRRIEYWNNQLLGFSTSLLQEYALMEPEDKNFYDYRVLCTDEVMLREIDMKTTDVIDQYTIEKGVVLKSNRNTHFTGICLFWNAAFMAGHQPIGFTTNPLAPRTSYGQTIFYLRKHLTLNAKDEVNVQFSLVPNVLLPDKTTKQTVGKIQVKCKTQKCVEDFTQFYHILQRKKVD